jgi:hypothetical protein
MSNENSKKIEELVAYPPDSSLIRLRGKVPIDKWIENKISINEVVREFSRDASLNFGFPAGQNGSLNLIVIDVDVRDGKQGISSLQKLEEKLGMLPISWVCRTGSGGFHYYFSLPQDLKLACKNNFAPGIDIKSSGGYVVAPGSLHPSTGQIYQWENGCNPRDIEIQPLPDSWMEEFKSRVAIKKSLHKNQKEETFDGFRSLERHWGLMKCKYFNKRVPKPVVIFFEEIIPKWIVGSNSNPEWLTPLFGASADCERVGIPLEEFCSTLAKMCPLGHLTEVDIQQIKSGYKKGSTKSILIDMKGES